MVRIILLTILSEVLTLINILDVAQDKKKYVVLTNTVYSLSTRGWTLFLGMYRAVETFSIPHSNVLALFGYE